MLQKLGDLKKKKKKLEPWKNMSMKKDAVLEDLWEVD